MQATSHTHCHDGDRPSPAGVHGLICCTQHHSLNGVAAHSSQAQSSQVRTETVARGHRKQLLEDRPLRASTGDRLGGLLAGRPGSAALQLPGGADPAELSQSSLRGSAKTGGSWYSLCSARRCSSSLPRTRGMQGTSLPVCSALQMKPSGVVAWAIWRPCSDLRETSWPLGAVSCCCSGLLAGHGRAGMSGGFLAGPL